MVFIRDCFYLQIYTFFETICLFAAKKNKKRVFPEHRGKNCGHKADFVYATTLRKCPNKFGISLSFRSYRDP